MHEKIKTEDYSIFKKHPHNRPIDEKIVTLLIASIRTKNLLEFRPLLVDKSMRLIDGQHRLEAAKILNIPIWYEHHEESLETEEIIILNANQKQWTTNDWVHLHISQGNDNYSKLKRLAEEKKMTVAELARLVGSTGPHKRLELKRGTFVFPNEEDLAQVNEVFAKLEEVTKSIIRLSVKKPKFLQSSKFRSSLFLFLIREDVSVELFIKKLTSRVELLRPCFDTATYTGLFKDIYNWKNSNPVD